MHPSPANCSVDYDAKGVQHGYICIPHSRDDSAYGAVMLPVAVISNGEGPTVLFTGGNHGDEYQGPLALIKLANSLQAGEVQGRLIIAPTMNQPAFAAARRTSPIDQGNLNRAFPGSPNGTMTQKIADYFTRYLLPLADYVMDIHDGGKTLEFVPMCATHVLVDKSAQAIGKRAVDAFAAPYSCELIEIDTLGMWDTTVEESGTIFITTELGGTGTTRPDWSEIMDVGVRNVLQHWGVLAGEPTVRPTQQLVVPEQGGYIISTSDGLIDWLVSPGDLIRVGQPIARVHDPVRLGTAPTEYEATLDGILAMKHFPGLVKMGDAIAMQAQVVD
ncbi:MAG: N-alpha-acetyl-L-2,4-diaminobutyrate deacetylase [Gammaproteobacteria bacterium]|jgi:N-alpha-acetyl-L-2,4-diaminobutyrate deacetylase